MGMSWLERLKGHGRPYQMTCDCPNENGNDAASTNDKSFLQHCNVLRKSRKRNPAIVMHVRLPCFILRWATWFLTQPCCEKLRFVHPRNANLTQKMRPNIIQVCCPQCCLPQHNTFWRCWYDRKQINRAIFCRLRCVIFWLVLPTCSMSIMCLICQCWRGTIISERLAHVQARFVLYCWSPLGWFGDHPCMVLHILASHFAISFEALFGTSFHVETPSCDRSRRFLMFVFFLIRLFSCGDCSKYISFGLNCFMINVCLSLSATQINLIQLRPWILQIDVLPQNFPQK